MWLDPVVNSLGVQGCVGGTRDSGDLVGDSVILGFVCWVNSVGEFVDYWNTIVETIGNCSSSLNDWSSMDVYILASNNSIVTSDLFSG